MWIKERFPEMRFEIAFVHLCGKREFVVGAF
jgi:hypothetical protein